MRSITRGALILTTLIGVVAVDVPATAETPPAGPPVADSGTVVEVAPPAETPLPAQPADASATPRIVRGPYLQNVTPDAITIRWRTDLPTVSRVDWGPAAGPLGQTALDPASRTEHEIRLEGLSSATAYGYRVMSEAGPLDVTAIFRTAPEPGSTGPLRIWVQGDSGTATPAAEAVYDSYLTRTDGQPTDVWLMLGDNAYQSGTDDEYQAALFEPFAELLRSTPLYPTLGNHDGFTATSSTQSGPYYDIFTLPTAGEGGGVASGTEAYYSFDHGNVHFVVLNSTDVNRSATGAMATWLEADLASTTQEWVVAYWHHPPYSKGSHDSDASNPLIQMRETFVAILESYGVDLTLTGHSHSYERSYLIDGHLGDSSTFGPTHVLDGGDGNPDGDGFYAKSARGPVPHSGAVHVVAGSSGQTSGGSLDHPAMFRSLNRLGSVVLEVLDNRLDATFLGDDGFAYDRFTIVKAPPEDLVPGFSAAPLEGEAPLRVRFVDRTSGDPIAWNWDFDRDGGTDSDEANPSFTFEEPGLYDVRQIVSNVLETSTLTLDALICVTSIEPPRIGGLLFETPVVVRWDPDGQQFFDLLRGDLNRIADPNPQLVCVDSKVTTATTMAPDAPAPGRTYFYLVRPVDCAEQPGSLDGDGPSLVNSRDDRWIVSVAGICDR